MTIHTGIPLGRVSIRTLAGLAILSAVATAASGESAKLIAGTLTCKGQGTIGLILGSKENLSCSYKTTSGATQSYSATITTIGLDIGIKGGSVMVWTVLGSTTDLPAGALKGKYAGVSADASLGVGVGANALVGGSKDSVVLQPLSVQGQTGINLAIGVSGLTLR
jgi:hypothetical protein